MNPKSCCRALSFISFLLLLLFPLFSVKQLTEKKHLVDDCFLLKVYVNVPLGIFQFDYCQMESVFSAAARNH